MRSILLLSALLAPAVLCSQETSGDAIAAETVDVVSAAGLFGRRATVEGVVVKAKLTRRQDAVVLDFHREWQSHLSVVIPAALFAEIPDAEGLAGKRVRASGVVVRFAGQIGHNTVDKPEIRLESAADISVLSPENPS